MSLLALAAGVAGQYLGLWKDAFGGGEPSSPAASASAVPGPPAPEPVVGSTAACSTAGHGVVLKLDGAPTRTSARVSATVSCVLAPDTHLFWVVRKVAGTAADPHVHYTLRNGLDQAPYVYDADLHSTAPGSERTVFVVVLTSTAYQSVKQTTDPATGYVLMSSPPIASNTVLIRTPTG